MYDEINQQVRKLLTEGLRKYTHSPGVLEDEIYYFTKLLNPLKVSQTGFYKNMRIIYFINSKTCDIKA